METPGLDVSTSAQQTHNQYNYGQPAMYSQPDTQSQQQFYYNDFTSIPSQPQQRYANSDFGFGGSVPMDNMNHRQHYTPSNYYFHMI